MVAACSANQITYEYYCVLVSHSWSRHKAQRVMRHNGSYTYFTYHLVA
jgi:hypothetical protein